MLGFTMMILLMRVNCRGYLIELHNKDTLITFGNCCSHTVSKTENPSNTGKESASMMSHSILPESEKENRTPSMNLVRRN